MSIVQSNYISSSLLFLIVFFISLIILLECGRRIAIRRLASDPSGAKAGVSEVEGAIFALLGLMIAFTFYGAGQRYDVRRQMIVNETNAISTAWLRIDILPESVQPKMRELFQRYTDARINTNRKLPNVSSAKAQMTLADKLQGEIWNLAIGSGKDAANPMILVVVLPSLNAMFDIATAHNVSLVTHPPLVIFITLLLLILVSTLYVGYSLAGTKKANSLHGVGYAIIMVGMFYVIVDFEFPRIGLIHVKNFDQPMMELKEKMG